MWKIWSKRVFRELKSNFFRYLALFLTVGLGMYLIVGIVGAAETILVRQKELGEKNHVEDGEFTVWMPLEDKVSEELEDRGITLERIFYLDYLLKDESVLRVFSNRDKINRLELDDGQLAVKDNEIVLEKQYAGKHQFITGSVIEIADTEYTVTGIGTVPDYEVVYQDMTDTAAESTLFGLGFVTAEKYEKLRLAGDYSETEKYTYSFLLNEKMTEKELKDYLLENSILTGFVNKQDNTRINAAVDDILINKNAGIIAGVIVMALFAYVISVFVIHTIERESVVIGALYALGLTGKQLVRQYLLLPVLITAAGGIVGTALGFSPWGMEIQMASTENYFSLPAMPSVYPPYLIIYGLVLPPVMAVLVNYFVIRGKLSGTALSLMRREEKGRRVSSLRLGKLGFVSRFRIRQLLRDSRSCIAVILGMFIALLVMMLGVDCYVICRNMAIQNREDTLFEYMYIYQDSEAEIPEGGEACYRKTLKKEVWGYDLDVVMLGVAEGNPYFDFAVTKEPGEITVSDAAAWKYGLKEGDTLVLTDTIQECDYTFTVGKIVPYSVGLYVFMNIDKMRNLFEQEESYFNTVLSQQELEIPTEELYAVITKADIAKKADVFTEQMMPLVVTMIGTSVLVFVIVMYLMMRVAVDRQAFPIALIKIFGYKQGEVRRLYLSGPFIVVAVSGMLVIPLAKGIMDRLYPYLASNVACGVDLTFGWELYLMIYMGILLCYQAIDVILAGRIKRMTPAEVLKNRE